MGTFAEYRERVAERERKLEAEYSSKIIALSEDVLSAKKAFEERMKEFACMQLQERFEREKEAALDKLRQEHVKEMRSLEERCNQAKLLQLEQRFVLQGLNIHISEQRQSAATCSRSSAWRKSASRCAMRRSASATRSRASCAGRRLADIITGAYG